MIESCFMALATIFQSYKGDSSHYSCHSWVSPVLGWGSEASCPRTVARKKKKKKNPEDPVRLETRIPGLRVKRFTSEPSGTPSGEEMYCVKLPFGKLQVFVVSRLYQSMSPVNGCYQLRWHFIIFVKVVM